LNIAFCSCILFLIVLSSLSIVKYSSLSLLKTVIFSSMPHLGYMNIIVFCCWWCNGFSMCYMAVFKSEEAVTSS
jgi:hypothetical protein